MEQHVGHQGFLSRVLVKLRDRAAPGWPIDTNPSDFFALKEICGLDDLLTKFQGIRPTKLFTSVPGDKIINIVDGAKRLEPDYLPPNFLNYFAIDCPRQTDVHLLLKMLRQSNSVELAYFENGTALPPSLNLNLNPMTSYQRYLEPAPMGIDAKYSWTIRGGDGSGEVKFIDIEKGWILDHEDIIVKTIPETGMNSLEDQDHGAAVLGVILMQDNSVGGIGITPRAKGFVISQWRPDGSPNTADAIMTAIDCLSFGDILLIEAQAYDGPNCSKLWPVEIQEAIFQVIRLATANGIVVIEAAGNGNDSGTIGNDLDVYIDANGKKTLEPKGSDFKDSGAILVAACNSDAHPGRIRSSNFGSRIDCYALGENVVSAGNFPKPSFNAVNKYTSKFCGTSSAAAIIAGAAIAIQSISEICNNVRLSPKEMRKIIGSDLLGTSSVNGRSVDKIGVMPDLRKIINESILNRS